MSAWAEDGFHLGDCFAVAQGFAETGIILACQQLRIPLIRNHKSPFRIVHGLPIGQGGRPKGLRFWHAWVEYTTPDGFVLVYDYSNGRDIKLLRDRYYHHGTLDEDHVWRYTPAEAREHYKKAGRCGPWVPGYETMEDPSLHNLEEVT